LSEDFSKAFLLAAGLGTRLRPLTEQIPKCLVPIHGKPLLSIWLETCEELGIREILINTHHLAEQVGAWSQKQGSRVRIRLVHEQTLRGSAGTVAANRDFVRGSANFYVFYADNLVDANLDALKAFHLDHDGPLTLGLFRSTKPEECGIVSLDPSGRITGFEEKPANPKSDLANAGIYVARQELFHYLPSSGFADFGKDVMPKLVGALWGFPLDGYLLDIGTPENYQKALNEWRAVMRTRAGMRGRGYLEQGAGC